MKTRMRKFPKKSNQDGEFLWLVSLSDLMILLFVFFVVLYSFNSQSSRKMGLESLTGTFSEHPETTPKAQVDGIQKKLLKWVIDRNLIGAISVEQKEDALILNIREKVLFESGGAELKEASIELIDMLRSALLHIPSPYRIGIEGHTDDHPFSGKSTVDNWELSSQRAHAVLLALKLPREIQNRTVLMGYGEMKPLLPNRSPEGKELPENQARNRRVTVRIF